MEVELSKRRYRLIFNNDGGTLFRPFIPKTEVPFSVEILVQYRNEGRQSRFPDRLSEESCVKLMWP